MEKITYYIHSQNKQVNPTITNPPKLWKIVLLFRNFIFRMLFNKFFRGYVIVGLDPSNSDIFDKILSIIVQNL